MLNDSGLIAVILISFLNLIPAGIFAFTIVSLLPDKLGTSLEENLRKLKPVLPEQNVAVLYTTYNDFMAEHASYDIAEARKGGMTFFILDDSTDITKRVEVDRFASAHDCRVVRRESRTGYKAGAINQWMKTFGGEYEYFFILDSDSRADFRAIKYCYELARRDPKIAIVQSKTLTMTSNPTRLTTSSVTIQHAYMEIVQRAMRNLGTSPYYGHNALLKTSALLAVGGFVEESNEDYKTLSLLHAKGFSSMYAERAVSWEEVPPDYISARKRSLRWSRDAVSQLGLVRVGTPLAIAFFLFYGWVTHMSNVALIVFLPFMAWASLPHLFSSGMIEIAGGATLSVIILWPMVALRVKDPELTARKMTSALFWGSVYNIPMMGPIALQIAKTTCLRLWAKVKSLSGFDEQYVKEFVVTPKSRQGSASLRFFASRLKAEIVLGVALIAVSLASMHLSALLFAFPQIASALTLPVLVYVEAKDRGVLHAKPIALQPVYAPFPARLRRAEREAYLVFPNNLRIGLR